MRQLRFWYSSQPLTIRSISRSGVSIVMAESSVAPEFDDLLERLLNLLSVAVVADHGERGVAIGRFAEQIRALESAAGRQFDRHLPGRAWIEPVAIAAIERLRRQRLPPARAHRRTAKKRSLDRK